MKKIIELYKKLSVREKRVLWITGVALLILGTDRLAINPIVNRLSVLDQSIKAEEMSIKKSLHVLKQEKRVQSEAKELAQFLITSKNPEQEMTEFLKEIQTFANESEVSLLYVKPASTKEESGSKKYYANLECEAQMDKLVKFFYSLESSPRLLKVEKFDLQPKSKESSIGRCAVTVSRMVFE